MGSGVGLENEPLLDGVRFPTRIDCTACGGELSFLPDSSPLIILCENGHFLTLSDLLDEALHLGKELTVTAVVCWTERARILREWAGWALKCGHILVAADFHEAASRITGWASKLSALLSQKEGYSRLPH